MDAVVLCVPGGIESQASPLLGSALLVRQADWLLGAGVERLIVNRVAAPPRGYSPTPALGALAERVVWVPSAEPLSYTECLRRAGSKGPVAVVEHAVLSNLDLRQAAELALQSGQDVCVRPTPDVAQTALDMPPVWIRHPQPSTSAPLQSTAAGWTARLDSEEALHAFAERVLSHGAELVIAGTEVQPGIWKARGALVVEGAELVAPCYLGPESFVAAGASVGPGAILGRGAIVEADAKVIHARVADGVVVGQGIVLEGATAFTDAVLLHAGPRVPIDDPLLLDSASALELVSRSAATVCESVARLVGLPEDQPSVALLRDISAGKASWIGVRSADSPACLVDVADVLTSGQADADELTRATRYYEAKKTPQLDAQLLWQLAWKRLRPRGDNDEVVAR